MIQIDDAGWGSMIGGVIIGLWDTDHETYFDTEVGVENFQGANFEKKVYLMAAAKAAADLLQLARQPKETPIQVCTGYCLDGIADYLHQQGYNFERGKITGPLQEHIEGSLLCRLRERGLELTYEELTEDNKKGLFWWKQIAWLKDGNPNGYARKERIQMCKTGWATFEIWARWPYAVAKEKAAMLKAQRARERRFDHYAHS